MQQGGKFTMWLVTPNKWQKKKKNDFYKSSEMTAIMLEKSIAPSLFLK